MRLYGYWRSSSTWRVRIALHLKGLPVSHVPVHLRDGEQRGEAHRARNPLAQVPVLELHDGTRLTQSVAILEFLEERHPDPPLLPSEPRSRARVREAVEIVNSGIQPVQNFAVLQAVTALGGDKMAWAHDAIHRGFVALEALAARTAGAHLVGDAVSLADVVLVPQVYNARRFGVDLDAFPTLVRCDAALADHPAFSETHPSRMPDAEA